MARVRLDDLVYRLGFENEEEFLRALERLADRAEREMRDSGEQAGRGFGEAMRVGLGAAIGTFAAMGFRDALAEVQRFAADSIGAFARFEQGLIQLKIAGVQNLEEVRRQLRAISEESRVFSEVQVSQAVGELVKQGFAAAEALELVRQGAHLAKSEVDPLTGSFADLGDVGVMLGQVMRAVGADFSQAAHIADVLAQAAQDSALSITSLVDAVARVAPTATAAGISLEETAAAIAILSNAGISAEVSARGLRSVINALIDPPATVRREFERLGITLIRADGTARSLTEVLRNLARVAERGPQGLQLLARGMDTFAVNVAAKLGQTADEVERFSRALENAQGAAKRLGDEVADSTTGDLNALRAAVENLKVAFGEGLAPVLGTFLEYTLIPLLRAFARLGDLIEQIAFVAMGGREPLTWEQDLERERQRLEYLARRIADLQQRINETTRLGGRVPTYARRQLEDLRREYEQTVRRILALDRILTRIREREAAEREKKPEPKRPERSPATPTPEAETKRVRTLVDRVNAYMQVLRAKLQVGLIEERRYAEELAGLYARLARYREEAIRRGDEAEANRALILMARLHAESERIAARVRSIREELAGLWPAGGEFAGVEEARRRAAIRPLEGAPPPSPETLRPWVVLRDHLTDVERAYRAGEVTAHEYAVQLLDLAGTVRDLVDALPRGTEEWRAWSALLTDLERRIAAVRPDLADLAAYVHDEFVGLDAAVRRALIEPLTGEPVRRVSEGMATTAMAVRALADELRRVNAEYRAGRVDEAAYLDALRAHLQAAEALLAVLPRTSEEYARLLEIVAQLRDALRDVSGTPPPQPPTGLEGLWPEGGEFAGMEEGIRASREYTRERIADMTDELARRLDGVARSWVRTLIEGIRRGDLAGALESVLGSAADVFLDSMLDAILGPIARALAETVATAVAREGLGSVLAGTSSLGALGPAGLLIGGGLLLLSFLMGGGGGGAPERSAAVSAATRSAPSAITYHAETHVNVNLEGALTDPQVMAAIRNLAEDVTLATLRRLGLIRGGEA